MKCSHCDEEDCGYQASELSWHEAVDRSALAMDFFNDYVSSHSAIIHEDDLEALAEQIFEKMYLLYQSVAFKAHLFNEAKNKPEIVDLSDSVQFNDEWCDHE